MEVIEHNGEQYVIASDMAKEKGVSREAIYNAVRRGSLTSIEVMGRRLIPFADALAWQPSPPGNARPGAGRPRKVQE